MEFECKFICPNIGRLWLIVSYNASGTATTTAAMTTATKLPKINTT